MTESEIKNTILNNLVFLLEDAGFKKVGTCSYVDGDAKRYCGRFVKPETRKAPKDVVLSFFQDSSSISHEIAVISKGYTETPEDEEDFLDEAFKCRDAKEKLQLPNRFAYEKISYSELKGFLELENRKN